MTEKERHQLLRAFGLGTGPTEFGDMTFADILRMIRRQTKDRNRAYALVRRLEDLL